MPDTLPFDPGAQMAEDAANCPKCGRKCYCNPDEEQESDYDEEC